MVWKFSELYIIATTDGLTYSTIDYYNFATVEIK